MISPQFEILNQKGTPMFNSDLTANRPAAGVVGRIFIATDSPYGIFRDNGTTWDQIASGGGGSFITGSGVATRVAFWDSTSSLSSNTNLYWDDTNNRLGINTATPGSPLDIHGTGTNAQFNGTGTNNAFLTFQNSGTGKWRIGNVYNTGNNYFQIFDVLNSSERLKLENNGSWTIIANTNSTPLTTWGNLLYNYFTISAGANFVLSGGIQTATSNFFQQTYQGSATYQISNVSAANLSVNSVNFSAAGSTITFIQSNIRAMAVNAGQFQYGGTNSGTITHAANTFLYGFYRSAGTGTCTISNAYQLYIADVNEYVTGFTFTNRWGIYQNGSNDNNYFAGKILVGTNIVSTFALDVSGTGRITGDVSFTNNGINRTGTAGVYSVVFGTSTFPATGSADNTVAIGGSASANGTDAIAIGLSSNAGTTAIAIGRGATATTSELVIGQVSGAITQMIIGTSRLGVSGAAGNSLTFQPSPAQGTNLNGGNLTIGAGRSTGNAAGGVIIFSLATGGAGGATLNSLTERLRIDYTVLQFADAVNMSFNTTTGTKIGTSTTQKLGFWNVTPIVQPTTAVAGATFVANTGTAVNNASTFDGYTIQQVVRALRNIGLLA